MKKLYYDFWGNGKFEAWDYDEGNRTLHGKIDSRLFQAFYKRFNELGRNTSLFTKEQKSGCTLQATYYSGRVVEVVFPKITFDRVLGEGREQPDQRYKMEINNITNSPQIFKMGMEYVINENPSTEENKSAKIM